MRERARMAVYAMAGFYLAFLAYNMFKDLSKSTGSERTLMVVFMVIFALIGVGMMSMGVYSSVKYTKQMAEITKKRLEEEANGTHKEEVILDESEVEENQEQLEKNQEQLEDKNHEDKK